MLDREMFCKYKKEYGNEKLFPRNLTYLPKKVSSRDAICYHMAALQLICYGTGYQFVLVFLPLLHFYHGVAANH